MFATKYLFVILTLLSALVASAPTPVNEDLEYLVARTRTGAAKQKSANRRVIAQLDQKLSPPRDKTLFWSGRVGGGSAMNHAMEHGRKTGKQTLEMGLKKSKINMPAYGPKTVGVWEHASKLWAQRAKGKTDAFLGQVRPKSIYNTLEKPALAKNKKVTKLTEHHLYVYAHLSNLLVVILTKPSQSQGKSCSQEKSRSQEKGRSQKVS